MDHMNIKYYLENHPVCDPKAEVKGKHYRITVLTPSLLRLEYSPDGVFEDRATQMVLNRDFPVPEFTVSWKGSILRLSTENLHLQYDTSRPFSKSSLFIKVQGNLSMYHSIWRFGDEPDDLKGTTRTLDFVDGATELEHGLMSRLGFSVIDDSRSMILTQDGWVEPRGPNACDIYFLVMDWIIKGACVIFTICAAKHRCCLAGHWATGGADTTDMMKKNTRSLSCV